MRSVPGNRIHAFVNGTRETLLAVTMCQKRAAHKRAGSSVHLTWAQRRQWRNREHDRALCVAQSLAAGRIDVSGLLGYR
jgi:hypothetical protein